MILEAIEIESLAPKEFVSVVDGEEECIECWIRYHSNAVP